MSIVITFAVLSNEIEYVWLENGPDIHALLPIKVYFPFLFFFPPSLGKSVELCFCDDFPPCSVEDCSSCK